MIKLCELAIIPLIILMRVGNHSAHYLERGITGGIF